MSGVERVNNKQVEWVGLTWKEIVMKLSARNQFQGQVVRMTEGQAMAEVVVKVGGLEVVSAITEGSVKNMGIKVGDAVTVAIKATDVIVGK